LKLIMMWEEVGGSVLANVYNNKNFTALPVDQPMLQAALTDFTASIAATVQGGSQATNEKNKKKHELVALLRKLGLYVQANSTRIRAVSDTIKAMGFIIIVMMIFECVYRAACAFGYQLRMRPPIDAPFSADANSSGF